MPVQGSVETKEEKKQESVKAVPEKKAEAKETSAKKAEAKDIPAKKAEAKDIPAKKAEAEKKETTDQMNVNLEKETGLVETVLFLESEPLTPEQIASISQLSKDVVDQCLELLKEKYRSENSGIEISMITGGWVLTPKKEFWDVLKERYGDKNAGRLSKS